MKTLASTAALLCAMPYFAYAATVETCLNQVNNNIGVSAALAGDFQNVDDTTDMTKLQASEAADQKFRLSKISVCLDNTGRLASITPTVAIVPNDSAQATTTEVLGKIGGDAANECEDLVLDYANGEHLTKIEGTYDIQTMRQIIFVTSAGNSLSKGAKPDGSESSTIDIAAD